MNWHLMNSNCTILHIYNKKITRITDFTILSRKFNATSALITTVAVRHTCASIQAWPTVTRCHFYNVSKKYLVLQDSVINVIFTFLAK